MPGISAGLGGQINNNIQTDGLIGYWDAAYKKSYPRSGTTCTDQPFRMVINFNYF